MSSAHTRPRAVPAPSPDPRRRAAVVQSNYIPWKGYFDLINLVDEFVLYDDVQYTKNDWRNRNLIKTGDDCLWLTIPVLHKGRFGQLIRDVEIADHRWATKHWRSIETWYAKAGAFDTVGPVLSDLYQRAAELDRLTDVNELFLRALVDLLGIDTRITRVSEYEIADDRVERLVDLCTELGVDEYVSGPAAASYLETEPFEARGLSVSWMAYQGYPEYEQLHGPPFVHGVSVVDLLLNEGPEGARRFLLTTPESRAGVTLPLSAPCLPARPEEAS